MRVIGSLSLSSSTYIAAAIKTTRSNGMQVVALPYASGIVLKIWRAA